MVYERGARTTTPLLRKDHDLHFRFAELISRYITPTSIVDFGCGFGKSTQSLPEHFAQASVIGIDISEPCLRFAAQSAVDHKIGNLSYLQACAEQTGLSSASMDLVTSTMLLHEMPPSAITATIAEASRLLAPGGYAIHLDFLTSESHFDRFIHYGHARRNNEPFMHSLNELNLLELHRQHGFSEMHILPFDESPGATSNRDQQWRFPWAVVVARKGT